MDALNTRDLGTLDQLFADDFADAAFADGHGSGIPVTYEGRNTQQFEVRAPVTDTGPEIMTIDTRCL